jgi:RimJ/RimL family protein N-acetyltransferase
MKETFFEAKNLESNNLRLIPLELKLVQPLAMALHDPNSFFAIHRGFNSPSSIESSILARYKAQENFESLTYVFINKRTSEICGMSSFLEPGNNFKRIEIGFTWIATKYQRTFVNSESKLAMLDHAFHSMKVCRVEFSVDTLNEKSNRAMLRLGAKLDGTMRKWRFNSSTDHGDRNIYSILDTEFSEIQHKLKS